MGFVVRGSVESGEGNLEGIMGGVEVLEGSFVFFFILGLCGFW